MLKYSIPVQYLPFRWISTKLCVIFDFRFCSACSDGGHTAVLKTKRDHVTRLGHRQNLESNNEP